ncbi:short chain dehydrogenase [Nonomuraea sp. NPDC048826]|uniref:short chain dehydrogenase n=1 Tax=Nonomuraea sp. NPDC048826 TaxID=3364347 RepID=UPI00371652CC
MKILIIGAGGTLGTAVRETLLGRGHDILSVGRSSGDLRYDISDPARIAELYAEVGTVDAVVSAAGEVPWKPFPEMTPQDYRAAFDGKVLSQIELVRQGLPHVSERGSFTLITGVLARDPVVTGSAASMANGAVEAFVRAAAVEIAPRRINAVSPSVFTEDLDKYGDFFPGFPPAGLREVAAAYVRSVEGAQTGQVFVLP